ncbi:MAG: chemotaxis response regulator protein-glutamate methylesterase [Leptospiraceae bacterium]|nr:chemotaxis response regulator protein-glutamate methylesterase [Leptospiraceae bacterium]MCB1199053.1 chemotaxis response regulator protein-glutamate methylesterase [Leptospiraceae bacterium]
MIRVMIIDDSALVRQVISEILESDPGITVIGMAQDPIFAQKYLEKEWPDVIILDIEMPRMDGITFLKKIMHEHPTPVIICSTLTEKGTQTTMAAMSAGAVGIITKPKLGVKGFLQESKIILVDTVRSAAQVKMNTRKPVVVEQSSESGSASLRTESKNEVKRTIPIYHPREKNTADVILPKSSGAILSTTDKVIVLGASTGGTQAIEVLLKQLPVDSPGIAIVQHMPEHFTKAFADRLNTVCDIEVKEAENNDRIIQGRVLIAPGNRHMVLKRSGARYYVEVVDGPLVNRHRPSVDVLFRSAAREAGKNAMGIILTGMGDDGSNGMLEMYEVGCHNIAQDEKTSIVFGMPKEAIRKNAVTEILPLDKIPAAIMKFAERIEKNE